MHVSLKSTQLGLRNSTTRLPFRYGKACLTRCPQAVLKATIETSGKVSCGYSGDCLPPGWFDKSSGKDYAQQIHDMLAVIAMAETVFLEQLKRPQPFFAAWLGACKQVHDDAHRRGLPALLAGFGVSMVERAIIDAMARSVRASFHSAIQHDLLAIRPGEVHPQLAGRLPAEWLPKLPAESIFVRHTVGLADPLTAAEIPLEDQLDDGLPHSLEDHIQSSGIRYFKLKLSNQLAWDLDRLAAFARVVERHRGGDYSVTLDGNEQYTNPAEFDELVEAIRATPSLRTLLANTLVIEQPLDRAIALSEEKTGGIRRLAESIPVIIDESDGDLDCYPLAIQLGYRGVSSKNCKGPIRSVLNAGLTWLHNVQGTGRDLVMTAEDLCTVGIVPVQSDLSLVASLGLTHVERNGHHYHRGLSYLPRQQQQEALLTHADLYTERNGVVVPRIVDGKFQIRSLACPGCGFAVHPDFDSLTPVSDWRFESLGL